MTDVTAAATMNALAAEARSTVEFYRTYPATRGYAERIRSATPCDEGDTGAVEQIMRDTFGTLDHLDARAFRAEARKAFEVWQGFLSLAREASER